jgi:hypothetical protein
MRQAALGLLVTVAVAGCGSSASGGSGTTTTAGANNRTQVAECLRKQGVTVPNRPAGATGPRGPTGGGGAGFLFGGGQRRASNPKFQAAARKCGLNLATGNRRFSIASNPRFKQAINKFVTCVRKNGYDMPAPNLTGNGPVFDATTVNRNDPKFVKAATKCQSLLNFGGPTGPGGPAPPQ